MSTDDERRADGHDDPTAPPPPPPFPAEPQQPPADPTQPIAADTQAFAPPPAPYGSNPYGSTPYGSAPYGSAPYGSAPDPSAATPPPPPWSQGPGPTTPPPVDPYAPPAPPPGSYPYSAPPSPYRSAPSNTSAIVLTVLSGLAVLSCCNPVAIASLVLGVMGINRNTTDPVEARRLTRIGWWVFGVAAALAVLLVVGFFALGISGAFDEGGSSFEPDSPYDGY